MPFTTTVDRPRGCVVVDVDGAIGDYSTPLGSGERAGQGPAVIPGCMDVRDTADDGSIGRADEDIVIDRQPVPLAPLMEGKLTLAYQAALEAADRDPPG